MVNKLDTGVKIVRNVLHYTIGEGVIKELPKIVDDKRLDKGQQVIYIVDEFFKDKSIILRSLGVNHTDELLFISTKDEPTTEYINELYLILLDRLDSRPAAIVGMGGGISMDVAKAISNLLTNGGKAEDYQGWDLVKKPGIFKVAVPTLSGTGAEATRTCVMTNKSSGLKLGMNSDFTVYDQIIMDPNLTKSVPVNQYFYTGMDAYIHCIESLNGSFRNVIGDAYSAQTINLCRDVFKSKDMMSDINRLKLMGASYLGGCAIATSYVGVVHPFSAGLSVVLGIHHCLANCIVMRAMHGFYPKEFKEFWEMVERQDIHIPKDVCKNLSNEEYDKLYESTIVHEKPLINALGKNFKNVLTKVKVIELFKEM